MNQHPDWPVEREFLQRTFLEIERALDQRRGQYFESGGNNFTNRSLNNGIRSDLLDDLEGFEERPYFARMDFRNVSGDQRVYFGHAPLDLPHGRILDWRCDLYSLFLGSNAKRPSYRVAATGKTHTVDLQLKRRVEVQKGCLQALHDLIDRRIPAPGAAALVATDEEEALAPETHDPFLIRQLYARGDPRLQDIVETIQVQQDAIIRAPLDRLLLLHGVAGSGKTSIAYHRLAYLMFPEHGYNLVPSEMLVIGPNQTFLAYVRDLLPSLGVQGIPQRTFQEWAWERMRHQNKSLPAHPVFTDSVAALLDAAAPGTAVERQRRWAAARLRGRPAFRTLIERYAAALTPQLPDGIIAIDDTFQGRDIQLRLDPGALRQRWDALPSTLTVAQRRERTLGHLEELVTSWFTNEFTAPESAADIAFIKRLSTAARKAITRSWPRPDLIGAYRDLMGAAQLSTHGRGLFLADELRSLRHLPPPTSEETPSIDVTDVPGLMILNGLLYGNRRVTYRHIVLDEAQDFSPLQVALLMDSCPSRSMTIVGDTAQGIHAYRGLDDWDELQPLFPEDILQKERITQNYRSTQEIVAFENALQQAVRGERALLAQAVNRQGEVPRMIALPDEGAMHDRVARDIATLTAGDQRSVALITPDQPRAQRLKREMDRRGVTCRIIGAQDEVTPESLTGTVILPAALSKGLEFPAVLVVGADEAGYPSTSDYAGRLLFVAVSRALHVLHLYAAGAFSRWLDAAQASATVDTTSLPRHVVNWATTTLLAELQRIRTQHLSFNEHLPALQSHAQHLMRQGKVEEVIDAYQYAGPFLDPSLADLIRRLLPHQVPAFMQRTLQAGLPELLREEFEVQLAKLQAANAPGSLGLQAHYQSLTSPGSTVPSMPSPFTLPPADLPSPPTAPRPLTPQAPPTPAQGFPSLKTLGLAEIRRLLGKDALVLPKAIRKDLRKLHVIPSLIPPERHAEYRECLEVNLFRPDLHRLAVEAAQGRASPGAAHSPATRPASTLRPQAPASAPRPRVSPPPPPLPNELSSVERFGLTLALDQVLASVQDSATRVRLQTGILRGGLTIKDIQYLRQRYRSVRPDLAGASIPLQPHQKDNINRHWSRLSERLTMRDRSRLDQVIELGYLTPEDRDTLQRVFGALWIR